MENNENVKKVEIKDNNLKISREEFLEMHPYDQSQIVIGLENDERKEFFKQYSGEEISEFFDYLVDEGIDHTQILLDMDDEKASRILENMSSDDATDIIQSLDTNSASNYLESMDEESRSDIVELMQYEDETAGSIMTNEYIEINIEDTVKQAMRKLISLANEVETIYTLYVVDSKNVLVGVMSLKELIVARGTELIKDIMNDNPITVNISDDQEDIAYMMRDYDFLAVPVVDNKNHLLGIITVDDVLDVLEEEASEDYSKLAAVTDVEIDHEKETVFMSIRKRIPWLMILLVVGGVTSGVMSQFEETLAEITMLAFFTPLILDMAGNTGTQALAVTVRGISTNQFNSKKDIFQHIWREFRTGLFNGILVGILVFILVYLITREVNISIVISISILVALTCSTVAGALIPIGMNAINVDPAVASGPFITTVNDIIALTIYLSLATTFLL